MPDQLVRKVQVWIYSLDAQGAPQVLLFRTNPERGSFWQPVTGHVETEDESIEHGALREAREESGLEGGAAHLKALGFEFDFEARGRRVRESVFALHVKQGMPVPTIDPKEHSDFMWISPAKAAHLLKFKSNQEALARLGRYWDEHGIGKKPAGSST